MRRCSQPVHVVLALVLVAHATALNIGGAAQPDQQPPPQQQPPERGGAAPVDAAHATSADDISDCAAPGTVLRGLDDGQTPRAPFGLEFLRVTTGECRRCLKSCLGGKIS